VITLLQWGAGLWWIVGIGVNVSTTVLALIYCRRDLGKGPSELPPISILIPVNGIDPDFDLNLRSVLAQADGNVAVLISVPDAEDQAIPVVRRILAEYPNVSSRLVIGEQRVSRNPKINNLISSYRLAASDLVLMCDSNVALVPGALRHMVSLFKPEVGLLSGVPIGVRPTNFIGELECALLNGYGARWLCAAALLGLDFPVGKFLFVRKTDLDRLGGLEPMARHPCEDRAIAAGMKSIGRKVITSGVVGSTPVGGRLMRDFISRHVRWCWCRRASSLPLGLAEPFFGALVVAASGAVFCQAFGGWAAWAAAICTMAGWFALEGLHLRLQRWPMSWRAPVAWAAREVVLPLLWLRSLTTRTLVWRETRMDARAT
jgi:ceramide glucosyltransferase